MWKHLFETERKELRRYASCHARGHLSLCPPELWKRPGLAALAWLRWGASTWERDPVWNIEMKNGWGKSDGWRKEIPGHLSLASHIHTQACACLHVHTHVSKHTRTHPIKQTNNKWDIQIAFTIRNENHWNPSIVHCCPDHISAANLNRFALVTQGFLEPVE